MSKILVNTTGSPVPVNDTGVTVAASGSYTLPEQDYWLWASSSDVVTLVGAGTLVVNDGSTDLSISDGTDLIKGIFPKDRSISSSGSMASTSSVVAQTGLAGLSSAGVRISGTWVGTITFQGSIDGTNYVDMWAEDVTTGLLTKTTTANGSWRLNVAGLKSYQTIFTSRTSGTASAVLETTVGPGFLRAMASLLGATDGIGIGNVGDRLKVTSDDVQANDPLNFTAILDAEARLPRYLCESVAAAAVTLAATLTVPAGKKWYLTGWDCSGEMKGYYQLLKLELVGGVTLYDGCEATTGWTVTTLTSLATSTSYFSQGSKSLTASLATQSYGAQSGYMEKAGLSLDWSAKPLIKVSARRSSSGTSMTLALKVYTASNSHQFSGVAVTSSSTMGEYEFDLAQVAFSLSAVTKIQFIWAEASSTTTGPTNVYIDNIRTSTADSYSTVSQVLSGAYTPYQQPFTTALPFVAGEILKLFVTNKDASTGMFEIGISGREFSV